MYRLRVKSHFDAAHKLVGYEGKCSELHGHGWKIEIFVTGENLDEIGILIDFKVLKEKLEEIIRKFDHSYLNDFREIGNPTSENISKYIFRKLKLPESVRLEKVRVWENSDSWCEYYE
ncbi:MAG TPA: 6-carboxytetrahydropterin synthase QueD [Archaeoglobaceae archaeon]|nr:6-carboxytetrahydropterin synthase QueD [Archaeoglobaceae archaeon]